MGEREGSKGSKNQKEEDTMNASTTSEYKRLNFSDLNFSDEEISFEEALKDVTPIDWAKEVLSGERKVIIKKKQ